MEAVVCEVARPQIVSEASRRVTTIKRKHDDQFELNRLREIDRHGVERE
jgi:hypothetical protein